MAFRSENTALSQSTRKSLQGVNQKTFRLGKRWLLLFAWPILTYVISAIIPPPDAVAREGDQVSARQFQFLVDDSHINAQGERVLEQEIFDHKFDMIRDASSMIVLDMFLFNDWQGPVPEMHRLLASELVETLVQKRASDPDIAIVVVTDPINTVYGGMQSKHLDDLKAANIDVVMTDLTKMQDSNPLWSSIWRWLIRPFGNQPAETLANPFGEGRVSLRSYLALLNFKANHRKLLIADNAQGELIGLVSSANPHDGSSAHRNIAVSFTGAAVKDLLESERMLLKMSNAETTLKLVDQKFAALDQTQFNDVTTVNAVTPAQTSIQVISESRIRDAVLAAIDGASDGDRIDMAMFYLSHRKIVLAMADAAKRGVRVRVLLDVNQDAFGREKNGVPNRPVAAELNAAGVEVRWCKTIGEQCHAKWLHTDVARKTDAGLSRTHQFFIGSANFTRRNLDDFNLETDVLLSLADDHPQTIEMINFFDRQWENHDNRVYSADYEEYADESMLLRWQYRFMEASGMTTF